jgi:hypothetical protein
VYPSTLADQVGCDRAQLEQMLGELAAPKPDSDRGWIMRDGTTVWLIRALECEPGMKSTSPNHRKNVHASVNKLSQRSPVVKAFRTKYAEWFDAPPTVDEPPPREPEGDDEGSGNPSERVADPEAEAKAVQNQSKSEAVDLEHPPVVDPRDETASPAAQESKTDHRPLPANARRLLRECFGITKRAVQSGLDERQQQVLDDMRFTLEARGATYSAGVKIRAVDEQHLDDACRHTLDKGVKIRDAGFRLVLEYLRDTWQETKAAREKAQFAELEPSRGSSAPTATAEVISNFSEQWRSSVARAGAAPPKAGAA